MKEGDMAENTMETEYRIIDATTGRALNGGYGDLASAVAKVDSSNNTRLLVERIVVGVPRPVYMKRFLSVEEAIQVAGDEMLLRALEMGLSSRPKSGPEAAIWEKAVLGDARAQFQMGWAYEHGLGVEKSHTKCIRWYEESRDNSNKRALLALGDITWGAGVAWFEQCTELLTKDCEKGGSGSTAFLGLIYRSGHGWARDPTRAVQQLELARERGMKGHEGLIGMHYLEGDGVRQDAEKGLSILKQCADRKDPKSLHYLGCAYRDGFNVEKDIQKAMAYLKRAVRMKDPDSCLALGDMYSTYDHGMFDAEEAVKCYLRGARNGGLDCMQRAIDMYSYGWLVGRNAKLAEEWSGRYRGSDAKMYEYERERK